MAALPWIRITTCVESSFWEKPPCPKLPRSTRSLRTIPLQRPVGRLPPLTVLGRFALQ
jgi:hypothetical protein